MATLMIRTLVARVPASISRGPMSQISLMTKPRLLSTLHEGKFTNTKVEDEVAILTMKHAPANVLSTDFMLEFMDRIQQIDDDKNVHGLILTSSLKNMFSSGLDLKEILGFGKTIDEYRIYYGLFQDMWFQLFKTRLVTIAALTGHAIAGGCAMAVACDYRLISEGNYGIGITSALLGFPMPIYLLESMQRTISWNKGNLASQQARLFKPKEALDTGLVDQVCSSDELLDAARRQMQLFLLTNHKARVASKLDAKSYLISRFDKLKNEDMDQMARFLADSQVVDAMKQRLELLKTKKE